MTQSDIKTGGDSIKVSLPPLMESTIDVGESIGSPKSKKRSRVSKVDAIRSLRPKSLINPLAAGSARLKDLPPASPESAVRLNSVKIKDFITTPGPMRKKVTDKLGEYTVVKRYQSIEKAPVDVRNSGQISFGRRVIPPKDRAAERH